MAESTRVAGWYPDPWGTDDERYFDGTAWSRQTRVVGSDDAVVVHGASPTSPRGTGADGNGAGDGDAPPPITPGWHPDPWGLAALRWWDGSTWTGHVSGPPAPKSVVVDVEGERALARWVRPALLIGGLAHAIGFIASAEQSQWWVDHWDALTSRNPTVTGPPASTAGGISQLAVLVSLSVGVLFLRWFYRAARTGWSRLPARRGPLLSTLSFVIPVLNLWWPYQAALDMVPAGDEGRALIRRWWALWLLAMLCGLMVLPAAFVSQTAARVVAGVGALVMIGAAFAARAVVDYVTATHEELVRPAVG